MTLDFNLDAVSTTEFGVGRDGGEDPVFGIVPVDAGVQSALLSMVRATMGRMAAAEDGPAEYEPAEKHGSTEYLVVSPGGALDAALRELHDAENLPFDGAHLSNPETVFCYFTRFTDDQDRRLTAMRRATQFKGVLRSKLLRFDDDTLKIVADNVFRLDIDFDLFLDSAFTHIWRPSAFEFLGRLRQQILDAVPDNVGAITPDLPFVDLSTIEAYARSRPRAARYLASIRSQELQGMDQYALKALCDSTGVDIQEANGRIMVNSGHEMGFLEVLDRRRYRLELVPDHPERFKAASRVRIDSG
ncbi:MAG: hypothetical protein OXO50_05255 [Caldilineaceae bacterium]|nr:hypothetical protein [Caldilineaceae bacterium]